MKVTIQKEGIVEGLQNAAIIIPSKAGTSYIKTIWLRAEGDLLYVMSTDAGIEFTGKYRVDVKEPGLCGVQGRTFVDLIRQLPKGSIDLSVDETSETLLVEQGRRRYKLALKNKDWFQEFQAFPAGESVTWAGGVLGESLERIGFCIGDGGNQEATKYLCVKAVEGGKVEISGMDGHQFAMVTFNYPDLAVKLPEKGLLVEKHYLPSIRKWLTEDEIELDVTEKRLFLRRANGEETISLPHSAQTQYPDYNTFLSKLRVDGLSELEVDRKELMECLGRLQVFETPQAPGVIMELKPTEASMSAQGSDVGSAHENLEVKYDGTVKRICFPIKNLLEVASHFSSPLLRLRFVSQEGACGVTGDEDSDYVVVLMPIRIAATNDSTADGSQSSSDSSASDGAEGASMDDGSGENGYDDM